MQFQSIPFSHSSSSCYYRVGWDWTDSSLWEGGFDPIEDIEYRTGAPPCQNKRGVDRSLFYQPTATECNCNEWVYHCPSWKGHQYSTQVHSFTAHVQTQAYITGTGYHGSSSSIVIIWTLLKTYRHRLFNPSSRRRRLDKPLTTFMVYSDRIDHLSIPLPLGLRWSLCGLFIPPIQHSLVFLSIRWRTTLSTGQHIAYPVPLIQH